MPRRWSRMTSGANAGTQSDPKTPACPPGRLLWCSGGTTMVIEMNSPVLWIGGVELAGERSALMSLPAVPEPIPVERFMNARAGLRAGILHRWRSLPAQRQSPAAAGERPQHKGFGTQFLRADQMRLAYAQE